MGSSLSLRVNPLELPVFFAGVRKNQVPFAAAVAMTRTAQDSLDELKRGVAQRFNIRRRNLIDGKQSTLRVITASKRDWPAPWAGIGVVDEWFARHEEGGVQLPQRGSSFAVPTRIVAAQRTAGGKLPRYLRPGQSISQGRARRVQDRVVGSLRSGGLPKNSSLKGESILYLLRRRVRLAATLGGRSTLDSVSKARFHEHFGRELTAALKSERVREGSFTSAQARFMYRKSRGTLTGKGV